MLILGRDLFVFPASASRQEQTNVRTRRNLLRGLSKPAPSLAGDMADYLLTSTLGNLVWHLPELRFDDVSASQRGKLALVQGDGKLRCGRLSDT